MKTFIVSLSLMFFIGSCGPSKEDALSHYEKIIEITYPIEKKSIDVTAKVLLYCEEPLIHKENMDSLKLVELKKINRLLLERIEYSIGKLEQIPEISSKANIKYAAGLYLFRLKNAQRIIADSIIQPFSDGTSVIHRLSIAREWQNAVNDNRSINVDYLNAAIQFQKEFNIYDYEAKSIEEKVESD